MREVRESECFARVGNWARLPGGVDAYRVVCRGLEVGAEPNQADREGELVRVRVVRCFFFLWWEWVSQQLLFNTLTVLPCLHEFARSCPVV